MPWGQLIAGPPGSGKTTYCATLLDLLNRNGRPTVVVNLDFANDRLPYECAVNVIDLISLTDVMEAYELGPNGGLMYCLEYLEQNIDWLVERLRPLAEDGYYILFDSPGQAELYTHHTSLAAIVARLSRELDLRLAAVHLVDAHHCGDPFKFVAAALVSLNAMVRLELPHINALSKVDLKEVFAKSGLGLDDFTDLMDLHRMLPTLEDADAAEAEEEAEAEAERQARAASAEGEGGLGGGAAPTSSSSSSVPYIPGKVRPKFPARTRDFVRKFQRLNERLVELVTDFNLVNFTPISCRDAPSLLALVKKVDKANGFVLLKTAAAGRPPPKQQQQQQQRAGAGAREGGEAEGAPQPPTHTRRQHAAGGSGISSLPPLVPSSSSSSRFEGAGQTVRSAAAALTGRVLLEEADEDEDDEDDDGEGGGQGAGRSSWRGAAAEDED